MDNDKFEHQGRSKQQYERSARIAFVAFAIAIGVTLGISLLHMFWA